MMVMFLCLLQLWIILWLIMLSSSTSKEAPIVKNGCQEWCGGIRIPYPFGIDPGCFHDASYEILCQNNSSGQPTPFLRKYNLEVMNITGFPSTEDSGSQRVIVGIPAVNACGSGSDFVLPFNLRGSPYDLSDGGNVLMVKGCPGNVMLKDKRGRILSGCTSFCANNTSSTGCHGVECCQATINFNYADPIYEIALNREVPFSSDSCNLIAGLIDVNSVDNFAPLPWNFSKFPVVLEWNATFLIPRDGGVYYGVADDFANYSNMNCFGEGMMSDCRCSYRYEGNPYLPNGCRVARGCRHCRHSLYNCQWNGNYYCLNPLLKLGSILGFSIGLGLTILLLCCYFLYRVIKKRRELKRKANYFKRNGGLLLQQRTSSEGAFETTKIFKATELEIATNNFNKNRILGQGGQGTVYKGMFTGGKIVAIKKSKQVDDDQLEHFVNELVILSQINHRNVVKILGCCLETKVPLLVYEFIPNGTLYHLLHAPTEDFHLTWKMRLQIAVESANALAYLHSSSSAPIYHRDVKSSNILLDEKYRAKVSDFGTSRAITVEQTHLTTCVMGTYGYLDPEYFQSNQFTEKSDVYSFGVVLVELITGKKPICPTKDGGWISLATEFLGHMEISRLFHILDARVLDEGKEEEFIVVANLAKQCLNMSGQLRPSMKEIAMVLDDIKSHKVPNPKELRSQVTKCVIVETSDEYGAPLRQNTFCSEKGPNIDSSSSVQVQPFMPCTF